MAKNHGLFYKLGHLPNSKLHLKDHQKWYRSLSIVCKDQNRGRAMKLLLYERVFVEKAWEKLELLVINTCTTTRKVYEGQTVVLVKRSLSIFSK